MSETGACGEIYVGTSIEVASERTMLADLTSRLDRAEVPYVIIANVQIGGRQIDSLVATEGDVNLFEVKQSRAPVRGDMNGIWERLDVSGVWRPYRNGYQQALDAKNAFRSAMSAIKPVGDFYPQAWVTFVGGLPAGSSLTSGDFKVGVVAHADLPADVPTSAREGSPWTLADWRRFAASLSLTRVSLQEVVSTDEIRNQLETVRRYNTAVAEEYGRSGRHWIAEEDQPIALQEGAQRPHGLAILGPSGCGKTLMGKWLAAQLAAAGSPVLFLAAKDIAGDWSKALQREIGLLCDIPAKTLLKAVTSDDRNLYLIVDGLNELARTEVGALRGLRALARRYDAKIIVTAQDALPEGFETLTSLSVGRPSAALKRQIAERAGGPLNAAATDVLSAVGSGFEAEMIGDVGTNLSGHATRLALIDQYVRARLGAHGRAGAYGLRRLAVTLHNELAFSMAETRLDDFMCDAGVTFETCDALFTARLLVRRVGRVSFAHEMLLNASAAFGLAADASAEPKAFGARLSSPLLAPLAGEIVSGIEDRSVCRAVLGAATSPELVAEAANGSYGPLAKAVARELLASVKADCLVEIAAIGLELDVESPAHPVRWSQAGQRSWKPEALARLRAVGILAVTADGLQDYLDLCWAMDARLLEERQRLAPAATAANLGLRSAFFALAYFAFGARIGFSSIDHHGPRGWRVEPGSPLPALEVSTMSSGSLHFYLENRRWFVGADERDRFATELTYVLRERFSREPFHVQLASLHAVCFTRDASEEALAELTQAVQDLDVSPTNWAIGSSVIDALKWLGALEDEAEGAREGIRFEVAKALADGADGNLALSVYTRMFDHPFDSIYYEEIHALDEAIRHNLYRRALGSAEITRSISLRWICDEVLKLDDPVDVGLFERFSVLPDRNNPFAQDEWEAFTKSLRFLGRHGAALPPANGAELRDVCLGDIRVLVHAAESGREDDMAAAQRAWAKLTTLPAGLVIGCLSEVHAAMTERHHWGDVKLPYELLDLRRIYPTECLGLARRFLEEADGLEYFHQVPMRESGPGLAFDTIARLGDRSDLDVLRRLSRAHPYSAFAINALKALDGATPGP